MKKDELKDLMSPQKSIGLFQISNTNKIIIALSYFLRNKGKSDWRCIKYLTAKEYGCFFTKSRASTICLI